MAEIPLSFDFQVKESKVVNGLQFISPNVFTEKRGEIWTSFVDDYVSSACPLKFVHDKFSTSPKTYCVVFTETFILGNWFLVHFAKSLLSLRICVKQAKPIWPMKS